MDATLLTLMRDYAFMSMAVYIPGVRPDSWDILEWDHGGRGALVTIPSKKKQIVVIRGSDPTSFDNYRRNFDWSLEYHKDAAIRLHTGYARSADRLLEIVRPRLMEGFDLHMTGHSMGGAIAVCAAAMMKDRDERVTVVSFGQPRVTDHAGARRGRKYRYWRVEDEDDPVPHFPNPLTFSHFGNALVFPRDKARWLGLSAHLVYDNRPAPAGYLGRLTAAVEGSVPYRVEWEEERAQAE
eukprot:jgi/Mesvir1/26736/Mv20512-RA.1